MQNNHTQDIDVNSFGDFIRGILSLVRQYWNRAERYQKLLYIFGLALIASGIFHTGVLLVTGGTLAGDVSWRKPILFGYSFGITVIALAWVMTFLLKKTLFGWLITVVLGITVFGEVGLITMQQWRGVPSHFNLSTPFDAAVFNAMGFFIIFISLTIALITIWSFFVLYAPNSLKWAIRIGMLILFISQVFGQLIIFNGSNTFGAAGAMKLPHFLSLHGIEILPAIALLLFFSNWNERRRTHIVLLAAAGYAGLLAVSAYQTFSGLPPFQMSLLSALLFGLSVMLLVVSFTLVVLALRFTLARAAVEKI